MWLRLSNSEAKARDFAKKCIHNIYVYINIIYITHLYSIDSYIYITIYVIIYTYVICGLL